jgi:hypothetical protein
VRVGLNALLPDTLVCVFLDGYRANATEDLPFSAVPILFIEFL